LERLVSIAVGIKFVVFQTDPPISISLFHAVVDASIALPVIVKKYVWEIYFASAGGVMLLIEGVAISVIESTSSGGVVVVEIVKLAAIINAAIVSLKSYFMAAIRVLGAFFVPSLYSVFGTDIVLY
jgi:hypothetical protein